MRVADFKPESMLDFGAGPGTAIWAASEVVLCKLIQKHEVYMLISSCMLSARHTARSTYKDSLTGSELAQ